MQLQNFHKKSSSTFVALHQKHFGAFIGKYPAMVTLRFTESTGLCTIFIHWYLLSNSVIISSKKWWYRYLSWFFISYKPLVQQNASLTSYLSKTVAYLSNSRNFYAPVSSDKSIWLLVSSAFSKKSGCLSSADPEIFAFGSHCSVKFQSSLNYFIPKD